MTFIGQHSPATRADICQVADAIMREARAKSMLLGGGLCQNTLDVGLPSYGFRIRRTIPHNVLSYRLVMADGTDTGYDVVDHSACPPPCPKRRKVCENTIGVDNT